MITRAAYGYRRGVRFAAMILVVLAAGCGGAEGGARSQPGGARSQARDNVQAGRSLLLLAPKKPPKPQPPFKPGIAAPPARLLRWYREAEARFGVAWEYLAAVNLVETGFNRLRNASYAGAQGPMQFMPTTWRSFGLGGDIRDPHDAIVAAANYLRASGAPLSYRAALMATTQHRSTLTPSRATPAR